MPVMAVLLLIAGSAAVAGAARRTPVPPPLLLVTVGLAVSCVPGCPRGPFIVGPVYGVKGAPVITAARIVPRGKAPSSVSVRSPYSIFAT